MYRQFKLSLPLNSSTTKNNNDENIPTVSFSFREECLDKIIHVKGQIGKTVMDIALENDVDIEAACGGEMACSTCHCVLTQDIYDKLPEKKEEEDDMLDLAWGLTDTYVKTYLKLIIFYTHLTFYL
jgi:ferredoxin